MKKPAKPTRRGLEMLRILNVAWQRREKARGNWRGSVWDHALATRLYGGGARWGGNQHRGARRTLAGLACHCQQLARQVGWLEVWQITAAGRAAVKRAERTR